MTEDLSCAGILDQHNFSQEYPARVVVGTGLTNLVHFFVYRQQQAFSKQYHIQFLADEGPLSVGSSICAYCRVKDPFLLVL